MVIKCRLMIFWPGRKSGKQPSTNIFIIEQDGWYYDYDINEKKTEAAKKQLPVLRLSFLISLRKIISQKQLPY
jgi:hypothetical protein